MLNHKSTLRILFLKDICSLSRHSTNIHIIFITTFTLENLIDICKWNIKLEEFKYKIHASKFICHDHPNDD